MKIAMYPGSFDPITKGHIDIIERACRLFDEVVVVMMENPNKKSVFSVREREEFINLSIAHIPNARCMIGDGLSVDVAKSVGATVLIRGLRSVKDYEYEQEMANANRHLCNEVDTILLFCDPKYSFISSSLIKEMAAHHRDVSEFVSKEVNDAFLRKDHFYEAKDKR